MHYNVQEFADAEQGGSHSCQHIHQHTKETGRMTDARNGGTGMSGKAFQHAGLFADSCLSALASKHQYGLQHLSEELLFELESPASVRPW